MKVSESTCRPQLPLTGDKGDQFVVLKVVLPKDSNEEARALYQQVADLQTVNPRTGMSS